MNGRLMESRVTVNEPKRGGAWKLDGVNISVAENGFIVNKSYCRPGKDFPNYKNEQSVFQTAESMDEFVDRIFGVKD